MYIFTSMYIFRMFIEMFSMYDECSLPGLSSSTGLQSQRIVCLGAGSAGLGVVNALADAMVEEGMTRKEGILS